MKYWLRLPSATSWGYFGAQFLQFWNEPTPNYGGEDRIEEIDWGGWDYGLELIWGKGIRKLPVRFRLVSPGCGPAHEQLG